MPQGSSLSTTNRSRNRNQMEGRAGLRDPLLGGDVEDQAKGEGEGDRGHGQQITFLEMAVWATYLLFLGAVFVGAVPVMESTFLELGFMYYQPFVPFVACVWLWGGCTWVWTSMRLDYAVMFDTEDSRVHLAPPDVVRMAMFLTAMVLTSAAAFAYTSAQRFDGAASTVIVLLYVFTPVVALVPINTFYLPTRQYFFRTLARVLVPVGEIRFADFLLADVLTSLSKAGSDFERALCHMTTGDMLAAIDEEETRRCGSMSLHIPLALAFPYFVRLVQCLRVYRDHGGSHNLGNALKYSTAFPVIALSAMKYHVAMDLWQGVYKPLWMAAAIINSSFSFYWDLARDWDFTCFQGLSAFRAKNPGLKNDIAYRRWVYYVAAMSNLVLRISWTYKLSAHLRHKHLTVFVIVMLEVTRRFQWMFFRVETEYRKISSGQRQLKHHTVNVRL